MNIVSNLYPHYYYKLIESWDTKKIREYENEYGNDFDSNRVTGVKIKMENGKLKINCINFSSFYLPDQKN